MTNVFEANFVNSLYLLESATVRTTRGIPSGSILTSLIGSIVNYTVLDYLYSNSLTVTSYKIFVYDDDAIIGFNANTPMEQRNNSRSFIKWLRERSKTIFGMTLSQKDTEISTADKMGYVMVQPHFPLPAARLRKGKRGLQWDSVRTADPWNFSADYEHGYTHRGHYSTSRAVHFLKKSWDELGRPINTTLDTIIRLVNPEHSVSGLENCKERVLAAATDNPHNKFLVNQLGYVYCALCAMQKVVGPFVLDWPSYAA